MRIRGLTLVFTLAGLLAAGAARAQTIGDEIVLPAGTFAKDATGIVFESGGYAGTGVQAGSLRFPEGTAPVVVGLTTLVPASWVGHEIEVQFGGSAGALFGGKFRIHGMVDNTSFGVTSFLNSEDWGTTDVIVLRNHVLPGRRFGIAIGRDPGHAGDPSILDMNFEYLVLRLTS